MDMTKNFAEYLSDLMRRRGLRSSQVAAYMGVTPTTITNWLRGGQPRPESVAKLAAALPDEDYGAMMKALGYPSPSLSTAPAEALPAAIADEFARWMGQLDEAQREVDEASRKLAAVRAKGQRFSHRLSSGAV